MSKARLVITAVTVEKRPVSEVARSYSVARSWICALLARYRAEGEAAFEPRSRRPKTSPAAVPDHTAELIVALRKELAGQGLDAGPHTIAWHLAHHHQVQVSAATISRHLARAGLVTPEPKKRPRSSYLRFQADQPNECWQSDFTHYPLADGTGTEILTWLDDHSRYALSVTAHARVTGPIVLAAFRANAAAYGAPAATLTDNGMVYTTRFSGGRGGRNGLETELRRLGIIQKNGKPNHPRPRAKPGASSRRPGNGSAHKPLSPPRSPSSRPSWTPSPRNTAPPGRTGHCPTGPPPPPPMPRGPKPSPATAAATPMTGSATTRSAKPATSRSAPAAASITSASAAPTPEPTSCCWSRT
jgi:transposase InsO family protein